MIEQDERVAEMVAAALEKAGYKVIRASDALNGLKRLYEAYPDLIIMAKDLPKVKGEEPYIRIRQASYLPLLVLGKEEEVSEMLESGADAYMIKPLNLKELVARVQSLLRRKVKNDPGANSASKPGDPATKTENDPLTPTENRIARCLGLNRGRMIDNTRLIDEVWGGNKVSLNTLHYYMRRLRRKLADVDITVMRGTGYSLNRQSDPSMT